MIRRCCFSVPGRSVATRVSQRVTDVCRLQRRSDRIVDEIAIALIEVNERNREPLTSLHIQIVDLGD